MYRWFGFQMVATEGRFGRQIHLLSEKVGTTLCHLPPMMLVDLDAATGFPDCNVCIQRAAFRWATAEV
jgi:hypothetical protein